MIPRRDESEEATDVPRTVDFLVGLMRSSWPWILSGVIALTFIAFLLWGSDQPEDPTLGPQATGSTALTPTTPADGLAFAESARLVGETCLKLLVADTPEERASGLRYRESELDRVDGMLFVLEAPQVQGAGAFTMSGVVAPLEVGFYGADLKRLGGHVMEPCAGTIADCPQYRASEGWQFGIETMPGKLPAGDLGVECTA